MSSRSANQAFSKWPIFSLLDDSFLSTLKLACVFGSSGNEAVVVSSDDQVYALGSNSNNCLGLGPSKAPSFQAQRIEELCDKGITAIAYGSGPHVVAMTTAGELYSWGHDTYGQLGLNYGRGSAPCAIKGDLLGVKVKQVTCGGHHTLALTSTGQVFAWGYNNSGQIGCGTTRNHALPKRVEGILTAVSCSAVCCGNASSVALSESGELYSWGYNGNGQLGVGSNTSLHSPYKVHLENVCFKQVACGYAHVLALTDNGALYAWGSNMYGQLGTGTKNNFLAPTPIVKTLDSFVDIVAACHNNHLSGAATLTGKVYMWGLCKGQSVLSPLLTRFSLVDDIFAAFGSPASMWRTLPVTQTGGESYSLVRCIGDKFDDVSTSDLVIVVEGHKIHVHKAILKMRCEYFQSMLQQGRWSEADKDCIEISHFPYPVYHAFLKFLYTDKLENLSIEESLGMLELADSYCDKELKRHCERLIWQSVTIDNVAMIMTQAAKYMTSDLEDQCMNYALSHMTQVIQSEGFEQLDSMVAKEFIKGAAKRGAFKT